MKRNFSSNVLIFTILVTFSFIVAVLVINRHGPYYHRRALEGWFNSKDGEEKVNAFRNVGAKSFPFLIQKLEGSMGDRVMACIIIERAFQGEPLENSAIKSRLVALLKSNQQSEQIAAYSAIRRLGLKVPDSEIAFAAQTCPSIKASEKDLVSGPKLARLFGMTNFSDCGVLVQLCNDADPEVQIITLSTLERLERVQTNSCNEEMIPALASLLKNTTDTSVLSAALAYIGVEPLRIRANLVAVCSFLETTTNADFQMECLGLMVSLSRHYPLKTEALHSVELVMSRSNVDVNVRRQARGMLNDRIAQSRGDSQN